MSKIINNAVITKCGECPRYKEAGYWDTNDIFHDEMACDQDGTPVFVNPDPIDKDCPLRDVEVILPEDIFNNRHNDSSFDIAFCGESKLDDIDHIIIVKKPTTDNKEGI